MAHEPHHSPKAEAGYGGNAEGVLGEQQHRPGMSEKVKHTLANVKGKMKGLRGEHASHFPSMSPRDDPQMLVGHPSVTYGHMGNGVGSGGENAHHRRPLSPQSPRSPRSPRVPVGHNPEFAIGVGEQAADTVMPGHHVHYHPDPNSPHHEPRSENFMEKVPGYTQNPYKHYEHAPVGASLDSHEHQHHHPSPLRDPERQHVVGEAGGEGTGEEHVEHGAKRSGFVGKLKDLVTGQKPGQGTGTKHATSEEIGETTDEQAVDGISENRADLHGGTKLHTQEPTQKTRAGGHQDAQSPNTMSNYHNKPGAVHTDDQGKPIEGPKEGGKSPKSEGVMSKIMEKLHIGQQKPANTATSPKTPTAPKATTTHDQ